jgi:FtsZ-binding cell division protein ZapB
VPQTQPVQVEPEQTTLTSKTPPKSTPNQSEQAIATSNTSTSSDATSLPRQHSLLRIFKDEQDRWLAVLDALCPECNSQQEKTSALLQWVEARLRGSSTNTDLVVSAEASQGADEAKPEPASELVEAKSDPPEAGEGTAQPNTTPLAMTQAVADRVIAQVVVDQARTLSWLTGRIEALEAEIATLKQQREQAIATIGQSSQLQQEIEHLRVENRQLKQAAARFEAARKALLGDSNPTSDKALTQARSADSAPGSPSVLHDQNQVQDQSQQQQVQDTTSTTPTQILGGATPKPARSGGARNRAKHIFAAICEWNQQHPQDTWAMTVGLLEETFGINRKAAKEFINVNQNLIAQHHAQIGVDNQRGHNRGKDTAALKAFVQQFEA